MKIYWRRASEIPAVPTGSTGRWEIRRGLRRRTSMRGTERSQLLDWERYSRRRERQTADTRAMGPGRGQLPPHGHTPAGEGAKLPAPEMGAGTGPDAKKPAYGAAAAREKRVAIIGALRTVVLEDPSTAAARSEVGIRRERSSGGISKRPVPCPRGSPRPTRGHRPALEYHGTGWW